MYGVFDREAVSALTDEITTLCGHIHAAEYRLLELIRELDQQSPWSTLEVKSCAHWLNFRCGIALGAAREKVRVAHALPTLPAIKSAFRDGKLSYSKVRAITRVATPETEQDWLQVATSATAAQVERIVRRVRQAVSLEDRAAAFALYRNRELQIYPVDGGMWTIQGHLTPEQGAVLRQALDRAMEWLGEPRIGGEVPDAARQADALVALAERFLALPPGEDETLHTADRYQVTVHVSAETLREGAAIDPNDPPETEDGSVIAAETARRLGCDAAVVPLLETAEGEPLALGRKTRTISPALRRALKRRDGGCRFPGCTHTRFVDGHHIRHWADGGETNLDNLVLLCRRHHTLLHEGGYRVVKDDRDFIFCRADGSIVPEVDDAELAGDLTRLMHEQREIGIHAMSGVPSWTEAHPNFGYITEVLHERHVYARQVARYRDAVAGM